MVVSKLNFYYGFIVSYKDISLERLNQLIKAYSDNYCNVTFVIRRSSAYYQLSLKGERLGEGVH